MKLTFRILLVLVCFGLLSACSTNAQKKEQYNRKIYLTEEDYLEDLKTQVESERRETSPLAESEYIFNVGPEQKNVYFFDERQQPKVPGEPSEADYKREKRLWNKPKRYTAEEYYGMQGPAESESSSETSSSYYDY